MSFSTLCQDPAVDHRSWRHLRRAVRHRLRQTKRALKKRGIPYAAILGPALLIIGLVVFGLVYVLTYLITH
ncbi:MAG TPA: hypothetical protein VHJ40_01015 [Actinomycetota bacterium]|nr:hypothetical protein [Actinomycetota bacterium]